MPRQSTSVRASSEQAKCPECDKTMSPKSIKRHMDGHRGINYPCRFPGCGKPFSQVPNRDQHEDGAHNERILVCDACPWSTRQNAEMTRHKQDKHGHPRRGAEGGRKISHSMMTVAADTKLGVQRSRKRSTGSTPYTKPASYGSDVSPSRECSSSTSFEESLAFSFPSVELSSPDLLWSNHQSTFFESLQQTSELDGSCLFRYDMSESFTENPFNDPEHVQKLIASMSDSYVCSPTAPSTPECTPPMSYSSSTFSEDTDCFPPGLSNEQWASMLQPPMAKVEDVEQIQELDSDWWRSVSGNDAEFLNEPAIQFVTELPMLPPYDQFALTI